MTQSHNDRLLADDPLVGVYRKKANDRKREVYWIGFLEGTLSSNAIELGEEEAILAEGAKFIEFFEDPDAADLVQDIQARCFSGQNDLMSALESIIADKRDDLLKAAPYCDLDEINEFLGFCAGVVCDGLILESEAKAMLARFRGSKILSESPVFRNLGRALEAALSDKSLSEAESDEIREWIAKLVGDGLIDTGVPNIGNVSQFDAPITDSAEVRLQGSYFVLTGPMSMGPRRYIISEIERCGGKVTPSTNRRTDYIVVSSTASKNWRTSHFGTKIEKAQKLISEGYKMRFVSETALAQALEEHG